MKTNLIIWVMGLSGTGKTTTLSAWKHSMPSTIMLDTDDLRTTMNADLSWGTVSRLENVRRYAELAKALAKQAPVIVGCTTPMKRQRDMAKRIIGAANLILVELVCPKELLPDRSVGNYYRRAGVDAAVPSLAGVNFDYEDTRDNEVDAVINTHEEGTHAVLERIAELVEWKESNRD